MSESHPEDNKYRSYICPCSKAYLSYPALFTHIKQKHDGKPPGDIIRPRALNKRGRPRKNLANQIQNQQYSQMPEYKSYASRQLFKSQEQLQLQPAISQLQSAKQRYQANLQFMPSIITTQLRQQPPLNILKMETHQEDISFIGQDYQNLRFAIKDLFEPGQNNTEILTIDQMQDLINLNQPYQQIKGEDRRSSRRPIGYNSWEMDFRTSLLEFLDWTQNLFTKWEFTNIELLIALTLYFFQEEVEERTSATTVNYVTHLNNLARHFLCEIRKNAKYNRVYILQDDHCFKLLAYVHQWLRNQNLTHFTVQTGPKGTVKMVTAQTALILYHEIYVACVVNSQQSFQYFITLHALLRLQLARYFQQCLATTLLFSHIMYKYHPYYASWPDTFRQKISLDLQDVILKIYQRCSRFLNIADGQDILSAFCLFIHVKGIIIPFLYIYFPLVANRMRHYGTAAKENGVLKRGKSAKGDLLIENRVMMSSTQPFFPQYFDTHACNTPLSQLHKTLECNNFFANNPASIKQDFHRFTGRPETSKGVRTGERTMIKYSQNGNKEGFYSHHIQQDKEQCQTEQRVVDGQIDIVVTRSSRRKEKEKRPTRSKFQTDLDDEFLQLFAN